MAMKSLNDLFIHMLRDMYYAEKQAQKALRKMAKSASSDELKQAFEHHRQETEEQIEKLEQVFEMMDLKPRGVTCEAINGIIEEAQEIMSECEDENAADAGMIAAAQAVEHYEISRYGTMVAWANQLGRTDAAKVFGEILDQEKAADAKLSKLAEEALNRQAA
jgi:ferritin-like metal-binding protein YciE